MAAGVVLELGYRISLLLHMVPNVAVKADSPVGLGGSMGLVGQHHGIARLRQEIRAIAGLDLPVLLRGETGTGKELVARALHNESGRKGPFVAVSLAALPPTLAAAELFGTSKGAFTGADRRKIGFFQKAQRGTIFLDEIGEAPLEIQVLLLRALESREITPVGSVEPLPFDARVVAATDSDLEAAMAANRFRPALLHRLAGYTLKVPPLRERREDIARLFFHFLGQDQGQQTVRVSPDGRPWPSSALVSRLVGFEWPGNVRQLRNVASWLAVKGAAGGEQTMRELGELLRPQSSAETPVPAPGGASLPSPEPVAEPVSGPIKLHRPPKVISDEELLEALRVNGWKLKPTAQHLNIARTSLYALIDRSETIRRATDLEREELEQSLERHQGDLAAMAQELRVSPQGLRSRLQELGIEQS
ncbi:MAG: sigma 54-interacting transcriptional regulator [Acidobacteriota bacterium]